MSAAQVRRDVPFNKTVLKWARERRGRSYEQAAHSAGVTPEKIIEWERIEGTARPTVRQARLLASDYDRPFLEFFSREIPELIEPRLVPDFRLYYDAPRPDEGRGLVELQSWAESLRLNALDLLEILGDQTPRFPNELYASTKTSPSDAARRTKEFMKFAGSEHIGLKSSERDSVPKKLRTKIENLGILVFKKSSLKEFHARGMCIFSEVFPVILFGSESPSAQAFTLVHELAHIVLKQSGISGPPPDRLLSSKNEQWCNEFAAAFLIPEDMLAGAIGASPNAAPAIEDGRLASLAAQFAVSRHAMLIRLVKLGYVQPDFYWQVKRPQFIQEEEEYKAEGRSAYYGSRYRNACGDLYTGLVLEAWETGKITNHNAGEFMGITNLSHLDDIRNNFGV
jgi:Zn-dependent peptidase ImmA (M78 family)/DNA-binding XRE family transcriptional regulator